MGILDFLFKKANKSDITLEQLLKKANQEPAYRAEFYKRLKTDNLFVITTNTGLPDGLQYVETDTKVNIRSYEDGKIPIFTSTDRIFDKGVIKDEVRFLELKGENLFSLAKGATYLLNPYSDYGKELLPNEVEKILSGEIITEQVQAFTIEKKTAIRIGQPAKYPTEIVNSLKVLFANRSVIKSAYVGFIHYVETKEPPHYIFGIEGEGDLKSIFEETGFIAKQYLSAEEFIDFVKIANKGDIDNYFVKGTEPFYKKV